MSKNEVANKPLARFELSLDGLLDKGQHAMPEGINADRLKLNALMAISQDKALMEHAITQPGKIAQFVYNFVIQGLDMLEREVYIVPYKGVLTPVRDYKAEIKLAMQYSIKPITLVKSGVVHENDAYGYDEDDNFYHKPIPFDKNRGKRIGAYCTVIYADGNHVTTMATDDEIEKVKKVSPSSNSNYSPWVNWPDSMWRKTVIKKAMKEVYLDFGGNEAVQKAYRESDQDVQFENKHNRKNTDEKIIQDNVFDVEYEDVIEVEVEVEQNGDN